MSKRLGIRWTIGDVSERGFEALRLSVWGAYRVFGPEADYLVCFNNVPLEHAQGRTGALPAEVQWHDASHDIPRFLRAHLDDSMAEGVGWKLVPLRVFPDRWELSLDNDCILWARPDALTSWLDDARPQACLIAEDVQACFGRFAGLCGGAPCNGGMRGLPPGLDYERELRRALALRPGVLRSELDEQGLQVAALRRFPTHVVSTRDVTVCSPFPPRQPHLGRRGAHFVGLNARTLGWWLHGRPAEVHVREHWERLRPVLYRCVAPAVRP